MQLISLSSQPISAGYELGTAQPQLVHLLYHDDFGVQFFTLFYLSRVLIEDKAKQMLKKELKTFPLADHLLRISLFRGLQARE